MVTGGSHTCGDYRPGRSIGGIPEANVTLVNYTSITKKKVCYGGGRAGEWRVDRDSPTESQVHTIPRVASTLSLGPPWISIVISSSILTNLALLSSCLQDVVLREGEREEKRRRREGKEELGITILLTQDFQAGLYIEQSSPSNWRSIIQRTCMKHLVGAQIHFWTGFRMLPMI